MSLLRAVTTLAVPPTTLIRIYVKDCVAALLEAVKSGAEL